MDKILIGNMLLSIVTLCTLISYLPQTIKLIKTKSSEDISVGSWMLWVISSLSYTLYAILVSQDLMLIVETALELMFCIIIFMLSIRYRKLENKR